MSTKKGVRNIAFLGLFGVTNLGNDSSLQAMLLNLRLWQPEAAVACICADPVGIAAKYQVATRALRPLPAPALPNLPRVLRITLRLLWRIMSELLHIVQSFAYLCQVDQVIIPGTGILDDFGVHPLQMPYDLFKWCLLARLSGAKVYFVSIGAGPIHHPVSRLFMKAAARLAVYRSYRDELSKQYMESIHFDTQQDPVYPDLVFSLPVADRPQPQTYHHQPRVIGIGVMEYYGWRNLAGEGEALYQTYIAKLGEFVLWLLNQQYVVRILIGQAHDQQAVTDLKTYLEAVHGVLPLDRVIAEPIVTIEDLFQQLATTDIVVATRFHNVLCALMLNKPVVSLGYARKNEVLMAEMGLATYCQHIESFEVQRLVMQFSQLAENVERVKSQIQSKNREYQQALNEQYRTLLQPM